MYGYDEITGRHITNLLLEHGIDSEIPGHIYFGIMVPRSKVTEAKRLLRNDAPKRGYEVWFDKHTCVGTYFGRKERLNHVAVKDVLKCEEYSKNTTMGRFFRSKEISKHIRKYPFLLSLEVLERQYLTTPTTLGTGYEVRLLLSDTGGKTDKEFRGDYVVLDNCSGIEPMGGYERPAPVSWWRRLLHWDN